MAGHNKWSQIKRKKGVADGKRAGVWAKFSKLICVESKKAKGDVSSPALRVAIERAKKENMPSDSIDRAVKKGLGADAGNLEPMLYEAYGPGGCAILIEALTDNKNRTAPELKHLLSENGGTIATPGAAAWAFTKDEEGARTPITTVPLSPEDEERLAVLLEALDGHDDVQEIYTNAE